MVAWKTAPEYQEVPQPEPGPGQVLVRVGAAALCHSDLHVIHELDAGVFNAKLPFTLGHETAGWVEALGTGATGLEVGEAVAVYGPIGCGTCARCQQGDENICDRGAELPGQGWGLGVDGGMAPYMVVDSVRQLAPLGDLDPVLAAPLTDAAVTPYRAIRRSLDQLGPGSTAVVIGIGGLGHLAVQILRAISPGDRRRRRHQAGGAGAGVLARRPPHRRSRSRCGSGDQRPDEGRGVDVTIDLVGSEATLGLAFATARAGSRVVLVGAAGGSVPYSLWATKFEVEVSTAMWGSISDLGDVIALARDGLIEPKVTTFKFDEIPSAFHALEEGTLEGRAVIVP